VSALFYTVSALTFRSAGKTSDSSRDLLSIMVNANIAEDVGQQLSDEDLLAREHNLTSMS
jgi:hypothetical protein